MLLAYLGEVLDEGGRDLDLVVARWIAYAKASPEFAETISAKALPMAANAIVLSKAIRKMAMIESRYRTVAL